MLSLKNNSSRKKYQAYSNRKKSKSNIRESIYFPTVEQKSLTLYAKEYIYKTICESIKSSIYSEIKENSNSVTHHCYECHKKIKVDVSQIIFGNGKLLKPKHFLCDEHKTIKIPVKTSFIWYRYEMSFYGKLKMLMKTKNEIFKDWD